MFAQAARCVVDCETQYTQALGCLDFGFSDFVSSSGTLISSVASSFPAPILKHARRCQLLGTISRDIYIVLFLFFISCSSTWSTGRHWMVSPAIYVGICQIPHSTSSVRTRKIGGRLATGLTEKCRPRTHSRFRAVARIENYIDQPQ